MMKRMPSVVLWMAAAFMALDAERAKQPGRLVLVDDSQFDWQEAKYKEAHHLFTPADPVLVGLSALQRRAPQETSVAAARRRYSAVVVASKSPGR
jgi:hypothetical protein